jgi:4-hydroxybenzoate polyprenyltransferase
MLDWLRLLRASGLATIAANLLAVTFIAFYAGGGLDPEWLAARIWREGWLGWCVPLASCLLFCAGMLWNDLCDLERDRVLNPQRPLPSGRIGLVPAWVAGLVLAFAAPLIATPIPYGLQLAGAVLTLALIYNLWAKQVPWLGSVVMALVRVAHAVFALLWLGPDYLRMALTPWLDPAGLPLFIYPLILGLYVFGLTLISELESRDGSRFTAIIGLAAMATALAIAVVGVFKAPWLPVLLHAGGMRTIAALVVVAGCLAVAGWLGWSVFKPWLEAVRSARRQLVGPVVVAGLGGMILLDVLLAAAAHPLAPLAILPLYLIFKGVGRAIRMD